MTKAEQLKKQIGKLTEEYYMEQFGHKSPFEPGDRIDYAGRVFDQRELKELVECSLEFWLTAGRYTARFEQELAEYLGVKYCSLVNSGSSANLLAFMALTSNKLGERRVQKGDEVITVAAGFPTTVAPILQFGAVPVFVDITLPQGNIDATMLEKARSSRTKAVMLAHTLGNPFPMKEVWDFCKKYNYWLIEDNCDALGSEYYLDGKWQKTGTVGHIGTSSFYPPHHMTMGEGGAVYTNDRLLHRIVNSLRDWGRDCWCAPGQDGSCRHRYEQQFGELPIGYDHKYVYSHFGYNLKATDMQAAVGCVQLQKLPEFVRRRQENWQSLLEKLQTCEDVLMLPQAEQDSRPSWFGFLLTVRESAPFTRDELAQYLEEHNIQTRNLFAGNLIKHPCFDELRTSGEGYRVVGELRNTDRVMNQSLWLGVYPDMDELRLNYMAECVCSFVESDRRK